MQILYAEALKQLSKLVFSKLHQLSSLSTSQLCSGLEFTSSLPHLGSTEPGFGLQFRISLPFGIWEVFLPTTSSSPQRDPKQILSSATVRAQQPRTLLPTGHAGCLTTSLHVHPHPEELCSSPPDPALTIPCALQQLPSSTNCLIRKTKGTMSLKQKRIFRTEN